MKDAHNKYVKILLDGHCRSTSYRTIPQKERFFFFLVYNFTEFNTINLDSLVEIVCESINILKLSQICFDHSHEGISYYHFERINDLIKILIDKKNFSINDFVILSGAVKCKENNILYDQHIKKYKWLPVRLFFIDYWETFYSTVMNDLNDVYIRFKSNPKIKGKFFLNFNRCPRPHRLAFVAFCIENRWLDKSYISFYHPLLEELVIYLEGNNEVLFPNSFSKINMIIKTNSNIFPLKLNLTKERNNPFDLSEEFDYYDNSYLSVISETKYFSNCIDEDINFNDTTLDCFFFTEKTYKAISARHPFIMLSQKGSLKVLREKGYMTFHPYINEEYDMIDNDEERLLAIVDEIKRLEMFDDHEWLKWQSLIKKRVDHNQNHLIRCRFK